MTVMAHRTTSNVVLTVIGILVAILVVLAVFFAIQPPTEFDSGTPEGTAQGYFRAVNDGDQDLAETFMTDELSSECEWEWWFDDGDESARVVITDTTIDGDSAEVRVTISVAYGDDPFGGGSYDDKQTMEMVRSGDLWLISEPVWPLERYSCGHGEG